MRFLNNQSGFALIQGMVVASVLAGSALLATRLLTDQKAAQKGAETRDQIEQLHSIIYSTLQNKDHCSATYWENGLTATPLADGTTAYNLTSIRTQSGPGVNITAPTSVADRPILFQVNSGATIDPTKTYMNNNVTISSMKLTHFPGTTPTPPSELVITYNRLDTVAGTKTGYGGKSIVKKIPIVIQRGPNIISCYAVDVSTSTGNVLNAKDTCTSLGNFFSWDTALNTCKLNNSTCGTGTGLIFMGVNSNGDPICRSIDSGMDFSNLIDPTGSSCDTAPAGTATNVKFKVVGDKVQIQCF